MQLIVGLGNPGKRYAGTWHNFGAMVVRELARRWGREFKKGRWQCELSASFGGKPALMIPTAYMNLSGMPVSKYSVYYKIAPEEILVIYDDHDLPLGRLRIRTEGSSGGHRGMDDIIGSLGTDLFPRLRVGIRTDENVDDLADRVLSPIPARFDKLTKECIGAAADAMEVMLEEGLSAAMNRFNKLDLSAGNTGASRTV